MHGFVKNATGKGKRKEKLKTKKRKTKEWKTKEYRSGFDCVFKESTNVRSI